MTSVETLSSSSGDRASSASSNESVQVIVRCRPLSNRERDQDCSNIVKIHANRGVIEVENPKARTENEKNKIFTYDSVYDDKSTQESIYDETIRPLVSSVLEGYNGCVFAYGQTGTGKTWTMEGGDTEDEVGIIPRAFEQIWSHISRTKGTEFLVSVRYIEIYMEDIRDLLKIKSTKSHELRELPNEGVVVTNLHCQTCQSAKDMLKAMKSGNLNRTTGATNMNEHSSRSHAIFQIVIEMAEEDSLSIQSLKVGKLNLVDLAGSERQSKTGASGDRLKEATKINKALSSLGNVIYALAENSPHIPYRDSKLTRLLQDSLGGNSKTIMIANIGPASMNYEETIMTLRYAYRAKLIKNNPIKNEDVKDGQLLLLQQEIERLKAMISEKNEAYDFRCLENVEDESEEEGSNGEEKEKQLELGKLELDELSKKLKSLEKQMVHGGKDILDSVNENEMKLEQHRTEIAERKKREIEMQQRIELEEETCTELKQVFASLQQQVDFKRDKLKRLNSKLQSIRQEIKDNHEAYLKDRQELEEANDDAAKKLRQWFLIIDNFVPSEERARIINLAQYDENLDNWVIKKEVNRIEPYDRPIAHRYGYPISDHALHMARTVPNYRGENILDLKLDMPLRTTQDYTPPAICPQVKAIVSDVIQNEIDNSRVVIKMAPHSSGNRSASKLDKEGKYKMATKTLMDVHNLKNNRSLPPKSAKAHS